MSIALSLSDCFDPKKGTRILVRVAKLLRLSIVLNRDLFGLYCHGRFIDESNIYCANRTTNRTTN